MAFSGPVGNQGTRGKGRKRKRPKKVKGSPSRSKVVPPAHPNSNKHPKP